MYKSGTAIFKDKKKILKTFIMNMNIEKKKQKKPHMNIHEIK